MNHFDNYMEQAQSLPEPNSYQDKLQRVSRFIAKNKPFYSQKFREMFPFLQHEEHPRFGQVDPKAVETFYDEVFSYRQGLNSERLYQEVLHKLEQHSASQPDSQFTFDSVMNFFYQQVLTDQRIVIEIVEKESELEAQPLKPEKENQFVNKTEEVKEEPEPQLEEHPEAAPATSQPKERPVQYDEKGAQLRLRNLFDFYCRQIQNLGFAPTFQKIAKECEVMSLSKIVQYLSGYGLLSDRVTTAVARALFKKVAGSAKEIDYDQFKRLVLLLAECEFPESKQAYVQFLAKMGLLEQKQYRKKLRKLNIPITANKMVPLDKEHHQKMLAAILSKRKKDLEHGGMSEEIRKKKERVLAMKRQKEEAGKQKKEGEKKKEVKEPVVQQLKLDDLFQMEEQDDIYMRQFRIEGRGSKNLTTRLRKGVSVVEQTRRRANQEEAKSRRN